MRQDDTDFTGIDLRGLLGRMRRVPVGSPAAIYAERPGVTAQVRARRRKRTKMAKLSRRANR
jgi:hypothetical protein